MNKKKVTAIILVAGNSTRFGQNRNKNFEKINSRSVLSYSLSEFDKNDNVDDIIVAVKENEIEKVKDIIKQDNISKKVQVVLGGNSRRESVYNCIKLTNSDIVIIHDGARPLIKQEYINLCLENIVEFEGVTIGVKSKDTIKITDENNVIVYTTKRSNTWLTQTPQCFKRDILLKMHEEYINEDITDDCMLLEKNDYRVKIIEGDYTNIKITTYDDLNIIKGFLEK